MGRPIQGYVSYVLHAPPPLVFYFWAIIITGAYWEGAPPVEDVDRFNASFPHYMAIELNRRRVAYVAELDK